MPDNLYTLCEGVGCSLRGRCSRYVCGEHVDRNAEGYMWIPGCNDETREAFLPVPEVQHS